MYFLSYFVVVVIIFVVVVVVVVIIIIIINQEVHLESRGQHPEKCNFLKDFFLVLEFKIVLHFRSFV